MQQCSNTLGDSRIDDHTDTYCKAWTYNVSLSMDFVVGCRRARGIGSWTHSHVTADGCDRPETLTATNNTCMWRASLSSGSPVLGDVACGFATGGDGSGGWIVSIVRPSGGLVSPPTMRLGRTIITEKASITVVLCKKGLDLAHTHQPLLTIT